MNESKHDRKAIGKRLRQWRQAKDLSTVDIQLKTGIARSTISSIEKGDSMANLKTLATLRDTYGLSIDKLFTDEHANNNHPG